MVPDIVRLNGTAYSWASVTLKYDGIPALGILSFDYEEARERALVYAGRKDGKPLAYTSGKVSYPPMPLKVLRATAQAIKEYLTAKGLGSYGDAKFTLVLAVAEPEPGALPIVTTFSDCVITSSKNAHAEGTEALATELQIQCLDVQENGMSIASRVRGLPL